jgi:nucleotide-binding universal stress UspA family protein
MYRRILVVTGDQPWIDAPVEYAIALAAHTRAELSILTVLTPPLIAGMPETTGCFPLVLESLVAQSEIILASAATTAEQAGVSYTMQVRWGRTVDMILRTAEEEDSDLIILGSHARTWRGRGLLGYVMKQLTACARQPLLVITAPPEESYNGAKWSRLLVVHDDSSSGDAAVRHGLTLAHDAALEVCLLHVNTLQQCAVDPLRVTPSAQDGLPLNAAQTAIAWEGHDVVRASGRMVPAIVETATARECDVIILGMAQSSGWKRLRSRQTARKVLANTTLPVLLVHPLVHSLY